MINPTRLNGREGLNNKRGLANPDAESMCKPAEVFLYDDKRH